MKKRNNKYGFFILLIVIIIGVIRNIYFHHYPKMYPNFGIAIPNGYTVHGIDVSHYQKEIDWQLAKNMTDKGVHLDFAIIKATEGCSQVDKNFEDNWQESKKNGFIRGAYHYFYANKSGVEQAHFLLKNTSIKVGDLPPIIDIEETKGVSDESLNKELKNCLTILEKKFNAKPIIYCNVDFYKKHLNKQMDSYPLWAAHYYQAYQPNIDRDWIIWQHNDSGHVNGIDGFVDFNVINGGILNLKNLCLQ